MFDEAIHFDNLSATASILACFLLALFYVVSLYVWSHKHRFDRDTSNVIVQRFVSVILSCFVSVLAIYAIASRDQGAGVRRTARLADWIGLKLDSNALLSVLVALLLTMILFCGPIVQYLTASYLFSFHHRLYEHEYRTGRAADAAFKFTFGDYLRELASRRPNWAHIRRVYLANLFFWRNYLVSPFTEEFVFRSCMLPMLVARFGLASCVLITPLFFGLAHLHHIIEGYKLNSQPLRRLVAQHLFQFVYTYVFGAYSSYLFLRTGSVMASFFSHAFCNLMGFPNLAELMNEFGPGVRSRLMGAYVLGFVLFFLLVAPLTDPTMFGNSTFIFT